MRRNKFVVVLSQRHRARLIMQYQRSTEKTTRNTARRGGRKSPRKGFSALSTRSTRARARNRYLSELNIWKYFHQIASAVQYVQ